MNHILSNLQNEVSSLMFADKGLIENINKGNNYNIYNFEFLKIIKKKQLLYASFILIVFICIIYIIITPNKKKPTTSSSLREVKYGKKI